MHMFMFQLACSSKQWLWYLVIYLCPLNVLFLYIDTYTYIYTYICWCPSFIWIRCSSIIGYVHSIGSHTNKNTNIFMLLYRNSCIFLSIVQTYTYIHTYIHTYLDSSVSEWFGFRMVCDAYERHTHIYTRMIVKKLVSFIDTFT